MKRERDHYYLKAKEEGYASRATYKLKEIQKSHNLLRLGDKVLELGSAPGGWTEIIAEEIGTRGRLFCVDLNSMLVAQYGPHVYFVKGDFTEPATIDRLKELTVGQRVDVVLSDAAPSTSGVHFSDAARSAELCISALAVCGLFLKDGGSFLIKIFAGDEQEFMALCQRAFTKVRRLKPDASKKKSREFYVLGEGFKNIF